ncbi:hypothetical protein Tco_0689804 [Tanacetum coccineum]
MALSIADQIALDDALVAPADRLKIGKCNLRLSSDITSKEATLQVVYDVLKLTPFYKAFQVTADAPEIYMQEFWASAYVHNRSVRFKMNNKKHIIGLEQFRDILQICPKVGNKKFVDPPLETEIIIFLASLGHSGDIRKLSDVNVNKLHQPWRSFAAVINKCLCGTPSYDSLRLSQAQILWDEGTGVTPGVPDAPNYDSEDDISWKSSDDDQDDEQAQDDEDAGKNDVNETKQDDEDDDEHDDNETDQNDDDEEQTESDDDGDDFVHPKLTTHDDDIIHEEETDEDDSRISSSDDEDGDNEVEGTNVEGAKSDEEATYEKDQGYEAVKDTNTDLDGRENVMSDVILPQVQATQEIEDTHVTLTPVNPDGQQQSSSVSSGFVSNMLNPNQDTGVDDIFGQHTEATSLIDTPVTAIMEPSFTAQINRPPTPYPHVIQTQQPPIMTPATTTSSLLQNLPNFASLFGFDYRLKALEDNFSELRQTNQYAEALSSIPGTVDQYLANKMQEAVDVAVQLKYDRIREESSTANQQFLDSIDDGMKKIIKEQEAKHISCCSANLSELELKKILIDKMEANNSINRLEIGADDDQEPSAGTDRGSKRRRSGKEPAFYQCSSETGDNQDSRKDFRCLGAPAHQEFELGVQMKSRSRRCPTSSLDWFQKPTDYLLLIIAWNKSGPAVTNIDADEGHLKSLTKLEYICEEVYKATTEKLDWINPEGRQYPHDLRQPLPLVPNTQGRHVIPFYHFINNDLKYLRGGVSCRNPLDSQYVKLALWGSRIGAKSEVSSMHATSRESVETSISKRRILLSTRRLPQTKDPGHLKIMCFLPCKNKVTKSHVEDKSGGKFITMKMKSACANIKQAHGEIVTHWFTLIVLSAFCDVPDNARNAESEESNTYV